MYLSQTHDSAASISIANDPLHGDVAFTTKRRGNGIQLAAVGKLRIEEYKAQLDHPEDSNVPNRGIGSRFNEIYGIEVWP